VPYKNFNEPSANGLIHLTVFIALGLILPDLIPAAVKSAILFLIAVLFFTAASNMSFSALVKIPLFVTILVTNFLITGFAIEPTPGTNYNTIDNPAS